MGSPDQAHQDDTGPRSPVPGVPASLETGTLVGRRYRILGFLGRGGMGEVYEAEDIDLGGRVALKTIRPELAFPEHVQRFKREILLARQVTSPHVARTFDVGYHDRGRGQTLTFLTMELLKGETLAQRLHRGRLDAGEIVPMARAMAAGLAAAHAVGIVHRDFKPGNVMLVPGSSEPRVVVTDFGLARSPESHDDAAESGVVGSPAYMAPEQVTSGVPTPATDVYSLGVVLYEMVTGTRPFGASGDLPLLVAVKRVGQRAPSPRALVPGLDPALERLILACLEPEPENRPRDASAVLEALGDGSASLPPPRVLPQRRRTLVLAAALVLLGAIGAAYLVTRSAAPAAAGPRAGVALLGFKNLSGRPDTAWLSTALVEMLTSELSAGQALRLVPAETVARVKAELALPDAPTLAPETLGRLQSNLGADVVVSGSYLALGPSVRLDVRAQRTSTGETLPAVVETGTEDDLPALVARAGAALRAQLGATPAGGEAKPASLPRRPEAARLYVEGLDALRRFDALTARDRFERAISFEPDHPLPHSALAEALSALGYDAQASAEARKALENASQLSAEQRLLVEGRAAETARQWEKAADAYRLLWRTRPDTLEYGLSVAQVLVAGGRARDALEVIATLRRLPPPAGEDPRVALAEASAHQALGDFPKLKAVAAQAAEKGRASGAQVLVARALVMQLYAAGNMAEWDAIEPLYAEARRLHESAGHERGTAAALHTMAGALDHKGDRARAREMYNESLAIRRRLGDRGGIARGLNALGWLEQQDGRPQQALEMLTQAVAIAREVDDRAFAPTTLNNLALAQRSLNLHAESRRSLEEAVVLARQTGENNILSRALNNLANAAMGDGHLADAGQRFEEAIAVARVADAKYPLAYGLSGLAWVRRHQARLAEAEKAQFEAIELRKGTSHEGHSKLSLADLLLDEGRVAEADAIVAEIAGKWPVTQQDYDGAHTALHVANVRIAQGRLAEAASALQLSKAAVEILSRFPEGRSELLMARARLAIAQGRATPALLREIEAGLADARAARLPHHAIEIEVLAGRAEIAAGRAAGRQRLESVEAAARAGGFALVAEQARRALEATAAR